jgi:sirohydrochlorin cobaltochelatase
LAHAYLLVVHGSRDPRPQIAVTQLAQQLSLWLQEFSPQQSSHVGTAQLELGENPLHVQIIEFAHSCGAKKVVILPIFLLPGVHVMEDIPAEVAIAGEIGLELVVKPFLGSCEDLADLFALQRVDFPARSILLAHGSRRENGNQPVEQLAAKLGLDSAYWSIAPSLVDSPKERLRQRLVAGIDSGATEIGILLYFLFSGGITDAISESVEQIRTQFPQAKISLGEPIGYSSKLVGTIGKMLLEGDLS